MFKVLTSILLTTIITSAYGQRWVQKEIGNKVYVNFPTSPVYDFLNNSGIYKSSQEGCLFIAIVQHNVIPNYSEFVKLSAENQKEIVENFLDNAIKGMLIQSANEGTPFNKIKIGKYSGREVTYSAMNPKTGNRAVKYVHLFYALNVVYAFQSFAVEDGSNCTEKKNTFFNSIKTD